MATEVLNQIRLRYLTTPGASPASLAQGEIAFNLFDQKLFMNDSFDFVVGFSLKDIALIDDLGYYRSSRISVFDDFISALATTGNPFISGVSGTGAAASVGTGEGNHPGIVTLTSGTTATGRAAVQSGATSFLLGNGLATFEAMIKIPTLSTSAERYALRVGFGDTVTGDQVDGIYFEYDEATSANWRYATASNSTRTKNSSSTAVAANTWYKLLITFDNTTATFYVNGTNIGTITTNLPTAAGRELGVVCALNKSVGTTARTVSLDYLYANIVFTTNR